MKVRNVMLCVCLSSALFVASCDKDDDDEGHDRGVNSTDQQFTMMASMGNRAEIELGQLAAVKGNNPAVKAYGQMMVTEHTPVGVELKSIATPLQLSTPDTLDAEHKTLKQVLSTVDGLTFDTAYINSQVRDHEKMISLFENEIQNGRNDSLQMFANKHLPHLRMHLQKADSVKNLLQ